MRPIDGLAAATEPWYCPVATMKALHQARAASPPGLASLAAHSLARSPVRPLLKVCSEICADACPIKARIAPRTKPRTLAGGLDCDMPRLLLPEEPPPMFDGGLPRPTSARGMAGYDDRSQGTDRTWRYGSMTTINNERYSAFRRDLL